MEVDMRSFATAVVVAIGLAIGGMYLLDQLQLRADEAFYYPKRANPHTRQYPQSRGEGLVFRERAWVGKRGHANIKCGRPPR
jgi:hypothetical protein